MELDLDLELDMMELAVDLELEVDLKLNVELDLNMELDLNLRHPLRSRQCTFVSHCVHQTHDPRHKRSLHVRAHRGQRAHQHCRHQFLHRGDVVASNQLQRSMVARAQDYDE